ncbi:MAG: PD-(D/E)XK nuclease family protein [Desulfobacteraceae bacterium]|nr:PD-(D/E)XK nuclease family protein [Desulfobacteraceae bacterium]MBC2757696.1 PD-(D/E)XK nuclease family protein [Desulfobacteraceae bacterium]
MAEMNSLSEVKARKLLEDKAVMVTVNRRLARYLTNRFNQQQVDAGRAVWETPDILPYTPWLGRVYDNARYLPDKEMPGNLKILLSPAQERFVWEQVINASESANALLRIPETAKAVAQAWEMCKEWHLSYHELSQAPPDDTMAFIGWADGFKQQCRDNNWQDNAGLADAVMQLLKSGSIPIPRQVILAGFDELSPQQISLIKALEDRGSQVFLLAEPEAPSLVQRCELADIQAEITAAAQWAKDRLEENPLSRIGIIVQDVNALRPSLVRIFDDVFHPSMVLSPKSGKSRAYNISLGRSLADYPVISAALMILDFACRPLFVDEYSLLLRSPFLGGADTETSKRAILDARIRENGEMELPVSAMIYFSKAHKGKDRHPGVFCPKLNKQLINFKREIEKLPKKQPPSGWVRDFSRLLKVMGWPEGRSLTSEEFQTVNACHEVLQEFSSFDTICSDLDFHSAISLLSQNIKAKTFQPETDDVPVQIMGMLEAVGERFDHLWVMGLDAESWPPAPMPSPFLPIGIQKKYNVSHASPERELAYTRQITRRLLASADQVMVSSPLKDGDTALFPSPLISHLKKIAINAAPENWWVQMLNNADFEQITDQFGPAADAKSRISGGTGLLKAQAACPFSAFVAYRLQAKNLEKPESGLNARDRGSLVHNALELFWEDVKNLDALKKLSDEQLAKAVGSAVDRAVSAMANKHPRTFTDRFAELEKERLISLVLEFLLIDSQRTSFTVVGREEKLVCTIADIELKTYADRIDRLDDGRLVIVDYKTGEPKVSDWFTQRIAEPQLPLYSFAVEKEVAGVVAGVVFGQVKKGSIKYLGVVSDEQIVPGAKGPEAKRSVMENFSSLGEVIALWKGKIEFLADEVRQGLATVAPVSIHKSCQYCDFGPMCRIGEIDFL